MIYYTLLQNLLFGRKNKFPRTNNGNNCSIPTFAHIRVFIIAPNNITVMQYSKNNLQHIIKIVLESRPLLSFVIASTKAL